MEESEQAFLQHLLCYVVLGPERENFLEQSCLVELYAMMELFYSLHFL